MKTIEFKFNGQIYYLCMNGAALFECYERFGTKRDITSHITDPTKKGFNNTCWLLSVLSEQGTAVRRYLGLPAPTPLTELECCVLLKPFDVISAKQQVVKAVDLGFARTEDETEEIDLGLAELNQKKTEKSRKRNIFMRLRSIFTCQSKKA